MKKLPTRAGWWLLICAVQLLQAQPSYLSFVKYRTEDGLSSDDVRVVQFDKQGFLWVGTGAGLNRFDGRNFRVFKHDPKDSLSLPGNSIFNMLRDNDRIWIGTDRGLCWFDPVQLRFHRVVNCDISDEVAVYALARSRDGRLWLNQGKNLVSYDPRDGSTQRYAAPNWADINFIYIDRQERIWTPCGGDLFLFNPKDRGFTLMLGRNHPDPYLAYPAGGLTEDGRGQLWVATWGNGLYRFDEEKQAFVDIPDGPVISTCIFPDQQMGGQPYFWVGGSIEGLYLYSPEKNKIYGQAYDAAEPYSHNGAMARQIIRDPSTGILWIATESGLEKFDDYTVRFQRVNLPKPAIYSQFSSVSEVLPDPFTPADDDYFIAVWGQGLWHWQQGNQQFHKYPITPDKLRSNEVFGMDFGPDSLLYIGIFGGVDAYDPRTDQWRHIPMQLPTKKINHKVLSIYGDAEGYVWFGANYEGVYRYHPPTRRLERWPIYSMENQPETSGVAVFLTTGDHRGNVWFATNRGLFHRPPNGNQIKRVPFPDEARYIAVNSLKVAGDMVWVATNNGLYQYHCASGKFMRKFDESNGLGNRDVLMVTQDMDGLLWLGLPNGLECFNPSTGGSRFFDKSDGLYANTVNSALTCLDDGKLFIGFSHSFNILYTNRLPINRQPPRLALTGARVMNKERTLTPGETLVLSPRENVFNISFAALNFSQSEKNQFAYRLEGFDNDWVYTPNNQVTYTNLDGGRYLLRVRGANNDGYWNVDGLAVPIIVHPPFYRTGYFVALILLGLAGIAFGFFHMRRRQYLRELAIRDRIARDLHDDVGSTLSSIRFYSEFAAMKVMNAEVKPLLQQINETAGSLSESMQDIIWAVNSQRDQLADLLSRMREFGHRTLESRGIAFKVICNEHFHSTRLGLEQRRNIYLIFKEAINNASKYAACNEVTLELKATPRSLNMLIIDDGRGFDTSGNGQSNGFGGNGMLNMRRRAEEIGGQLVVCSFLGVGTKIELNVRLREFS